MKLALPLLIALAYAPIGASATPLLGGDLNRLSVFADTYATTGANSRVFGSVLSGDVATTGAHASVSGNIVSVGAATTGGGASSVGGDILSGGVLTTGDGSLIGGSVWSVGAATIGANSRVAGNVVSDGVTTTGDTSRVGDNLLSGGAASVGANAVVVGSVKALGAMSLSASSQTGASSALSALPQIAGVRSNVRSESQQISEAQQALNNMGSGTALLTTMTTDTTLYAGVFSADYLSTTAGITLTLDGQNKTYQSWVFNIADYLVTGANTKIVLINAGVGSSVIWNTGGYASLGATSSLLGTILANTYISVGAGASVTGPASSCGGVFSATSYVSTGDSATIGGSACSGIDSGYHVVDGTAVAPKGVASVPEASAWAMLLAGLGVLSLARRRQGGRG